MKCWSVNFRIKEYYYRIPYMLRTLVKKIRGKLGRKSKAQKSDQVNPETEMLHRQISQHKKELSDFIKMLEKL
jgi:hypothetical protein